MKRGAGEKGASISSILVRRSRASADSRSVSSRQSSARPQKTVRFMIGPSVTAGRLSVENIMQNKKFNKQVEKEINSATQKQSSILHDLSTLESQLKSLMPNFNISQAPNHSMTSFKAKPHSVGTFPLQNRPIVPHFSVSRFGESVSSLQIPDWNNEEKNAVPADEKPKTKSDPSVGILTKTVPLLRSSSEYRIKAVPQMGVYNQSSNPPSLEFLPQSVSRAPQGSVPTSLFRDSAAQTKKTTVVSHRMEADLGTSSSLASAVVKSNQKVASSRQAVNPDSIFYSAEGLVAGENFQQPFRDIGLLKRYKISPAQLPAKRTESALLQNTAPLFFSGSRGAPTRELVDSHKSEKEIWLAKQKQLLSQSSWALNQKQPSLIAQC